MQDVEQPNLPAPSSNFRNSSMSDMKQKRRSVFFSKDDTEMDIPSLPVLELVEELKRRHGKNLDADEFVKAVEDADQNGDGLISIPELITIIESMQNLKKENTGLKTYLGIAGVALLLVLVAIFGLVFAVVKLTQEVSTGGESGNALVSKTTGIIVDTHPSDGGGIFLDMSAFTEPINITFPALGKTSECVGHISAATIDAHYVQFTTGGSPMTIRSVDYARKGHPVVYTHIPGSNREVTTFEDSAGSDGELAALESTQAIKNTMEQFEGTDPENRRRLMKRALAFITNDSQGKENQRAQDEENRARSVTANGSGGEIVGKSSQTAGRTRDRRRFLEEVGDLATIDDYLKSFAAETSDVTFTKDNELSEDFYFVCRGTEATATN